MRTIKKVIYIVAIAVITLLIYSTIVKATTTLKVTADNLNLREKASTSSNILALISNGEECELIEEDGDWYKVKYKKYTGYVSKEYVKKVTTSVNQNNTVSESDDKTSNVDESIELQTGKVSEDIEIRLLPLIYSSVIDNVNKNDEIFIVSELNGWSYIQTDEVTGWIRSGNITGRETVSVDENINSDKEDTNSGDNTSAENYEKKTMYIKESYVNVRKEPNTTSEIMMVLAANTKLTVIGESGDWYKVSTSEGNAYVLKELLSSKESTTSRNGTTSVRTENKKVETVKKNDTKSTASTEKVPAASDNKTSSTTGQAIVNYAKKFLGVPYVYGGASKSGFDCSGFTMYVYKKFGISMPHGAQSQSKLGKKVSANKNSASSLKENLQLGDLVLFLDYETMDEIGHCGIYIGNGKFIHASSGSGYCVKINSLLPGEYYNTRYCGARRVI